MTRLMISVASLPEASVALRAGADIIDIVATSPSTLTDIVTAIAGRRPVCASFCDQPVSAAHAGVSYVKLFLSPNAIDCVGELHSLAERVKLIAVVPAETAADHALLEKVASGKLAGAMLDTRSQLNQRLLDHVDMPRLHEFVRSCHHFGLIAGLGGGLEMPDIPRLLLLSPDILRFSAEQIDPGAVRGLIPAEGSATKPPVMGADAPVDHVLVNDFVLPVLIGTYAHERHAPQRVRFSVNAAILRNTHVAEDMRDVFSYDLITDGIRLLVTAGHTPLVETLAERIAAMVLAHNRVRQVVVRVEKLDTGSGVVGIEITRARE